KVIENFLKEGAIVSYNDPFIPEYKYKGKLHRSIELSEENLKNADIVVITTMHSCYDYDFIQKNSKFIFDTKNAMSKATNRENIELL
ncbi:MAG TPA: UDP binding domain-containing protein, partial [Bacillota bacterium]|nr:UDP binding domain-containing protein [Bacillota bacterium]